MYQKYVTSLYWRQLTPIFGYPVPPSSRVELAKPFSRAQSNASSQNDNYVDVVPTPVNTGCSGMLHAKIVSICFARDLLMAMLVLDYLADCSYREM